MGLANIIWIVCFAIAGINMVYSVYYIYVFTYHPVAGNGGVEVIVAFMYFLRVILLLYVGGIAFISDNTNSKNSSGNIVASKYRSVSNV